MLLMFASYRARKLAERCPVGRFMNSALSCLGDFFPSLTAIPASMADPPVRMWFEACGREPPTSAPVFPPATLVALFSWSFTIGSVHPTTNIITVIKNTFSEESQTCYVPQMDAARIAEQMRELHSQTIRRGRQRKLEVGGLPGCAPVGYINRRRGDKTWVEIDPINGPLVREAFKLAAKGMPLRNVRERLCEAGFAGQRGGQISPSTLQYLLRNQFYVGTIRCGGVERQGIHPPLVDEATFRKVQVHLLRQQ